MVMLRRVLNSGYKIRHCRKPQKATPVKQQWNAWFQRAKWTNNKSRFTVSFLSSEFLNQSGTTSSTETVPTHSVQSTKYNILWYFDSRTVQSSRRLITFCSNILSAGGGVPCHHSTARPQEGGDGLHIRRVTENILHKQLRTAENGWSSGFGVGYGANNSSP
jgi:hypothetical protein